MIHENEVLCAAFSHRGDLIMTGSKDKSAQLWKSRTTTQLGPALLHQAPVRAVAFCNDLTTVATASEDSAAGLWDIATGRALGPSFRHRNIVTDLKFTPDGRRLITASADGTARIWDLPRALTVAPQDWSLWVETLSGMELSANGALRGLGSEQWHDLRFRLGAVGRN
jgi:WD40 repeat protein